ncbi:DUF1275 domain-containing protein [Spongiibacter taiwanensis]|uniref:YoaK family protein n=1 Tax=Spongiibacter taiwanensis TaxID=1748242 RepID=UPI0020359B6B|nr:YoaK family protein [Spongiibacter taiwanensis]USA41712.1 DUF1275 domain-containing protein [Spongiibacter taiwanensis]
MINRLPPWVEGGAFLLTLLAGMVNAIGLLGFSHQAVSHLTGTATLLGQQLASMNISVALHLLLILISFVIGAALSGWLIENTALKLGRHYGSALMLEALLLLLGMWALMAGWSAGHFLASAACGLQNGLATTFSGAIIRTTHVSGIFTDLGLMLGARLRGQPLDRRRARLYLLLVTGFILGGTLGSVIFLAWQFLALLVPVLLAVLLAGLYWRLLAQSDAVSTQETGR